MACPAFTIENVSEEMKNRIILGLERSGAKIVGENPWEVDLKRGNIKLIAKWSEEDQSLEIEVTKKSIFISCNYIKEKLIEEIEKSRDQFYADQDFNLDFEV